MLFRISHQRKIIANGNFEQIYPSEYLSMGVKEKGCLSQPEISEYCLKICKHSELEVTKAI